MNNQVIQAMQEAKSKHGEDIFKDENRFRNTIADLLPGSEFEGERDWLVAAIKLDAYFSLQRAVKNGNVHLEASRLVDILHKTKKADANFAKEIICIITSLFTNEKIFTGMTVSPIQQKTPVIGSIIPFGRYDWRVLDVDVQNNKILILSDKIIEKREYNEGYKNITWETCILRRYLNGAFYNKFSANDKTRIAETRVINNDNPWWQEIKGGSDTDDKIFLLSIEEVVQYFGDSGQ